MVLVCHMIFRNTCSKGHVTLGPLKESQHSVMLCGHRHSGSGDRFVIWSCKTTWSVCHVTLLVGALMLGCCPAKFSGCKYCVSGDIMFCGDIIWLKTKFTHAFTWICHYCLSLMYMAWKQTVYHVNKSDTGYMHLKKEKYKQFLSVHTRRERKWKDRNKGYRKAFCDTRKHNKKLMAA